MKKYSLLFCSLLLSTFVFGQGEYDAMKYTQIDITGSARYVGMAGAFGALGGDMSAIGLNPAGIGVYRSSELTFTPVFSTTTVNSNFDGSGSEDSKQKFMVNNIGYVGSFRTNNDVNLSNFNFGISYNRVKDFNRNVSISGKSRQTSLLDKVCSDLGNNVSTDNLSGLGWLSYNTFLTNRADNGQYTSVLAENEMVNNNMDRQESGGVDEWDFTVGANWAHFLYLGASVSFQNINYELLSAYRETSTSDASFGFQLNNALVTNGGGVNARIGAIIRPIPNLRFGFALHTPTYYYLTDTYSASMSSQGVGNTTDGYEHFAKTDEGNSNYELITPGRLVYSFAYQFGDKALISMDWDIIDYREIKLKNENGVPYDDTNSYIREDMRTTTNFRLGGEYRLNENISLRAGTAWYQSACKDNLTKDNAQIVTAGTTPEYAFDKGVRYTTLGVGYRTGAFFLDVALMNQKSSENFFNFYDSSNNDQDKYASLSTKKTNLLFSVGFRF